MNWLREAIEDSKTGRVSSKRLGLLIATSAMSVSVLMLSGATMMGHDTAMALGAVCVPLAGLNGYSYVNGKVSEDKRDGISRP